MLSIENWINNINSNKRLIENGRWLNITFTFGIADKDYLFEIQSGNVLSIHEREILTQSGTFKIYGKRDSWNKHWLKVPPRDYHDIFAMLAKKIIYIDGDLTPFIQNLQYFKDLIASHRDMHD